jgi:hypothetical protein
LVDTRWQQYSTHLHTNSTQNTEKGNIYNNHKLNIHNNTKLTNLGSAGRASSLRVNPWYLPYSWGKSMDKPQLGQQHVEESVHTLKQNAEALVFATKEI